MRAVVLIGGKGTRLPPLTYTVPKSMVLLRNRPYIQYMVDSLRGARLNGTVLSMGYWPSAIQQYVGDRVRAGTGMWVSCSNGERATAVCSYDGPPEVLPIQSQWRRGRRSYSQGAGQEQGSAGGDYG
jgi:NDP-sugar pyrophosphorylase family protein